RLYVRSRRRSGRAIDIAKATFMTLRRQSPNQLRERPARVSQLRKGQRRRLHQFDTRRRFCSAVSRCAQLRGPLDDAVEYDGLVAKLVLGGRVSKLLGGTVVGSRVGSGKRPNRKTVGGEIDNPRPNCAGDVFRWLDVQ